VSAASLSSESPGYIRSSVVITEIAEPEVVAQVVHEAVPAPVVVPVLPEDDAEGEWFAVADSARSRRKAVRRSSRLAAKETEDFVDITTKAINFRALKVTIKGCSAKLQAHVSKNKLMQKIGSPMGKKPVSDLRAAAFGDDGSVPAAVDD
jgi:hypothetical protein